MTASELRGAARAYKTAQDKRLKAILNAQREGMTLRAIALEVGLTYGRVWQILNKENPPPRKG